jgi:hypothetical protein
LPLGADALEEHHQLQLEEDHRVDRWTAARGVARPEEFSHETEVDDSLQATIEVVLRDELFEREISKGKKLRSLVPIMMSAVPPPLPRERSRGGDVTCATAVTPALGLIEETFSTSWVVFGTPLRSVWWRLLTEATADLARGELERTEAAL